MKKNIFINLSLSPIAFDMPAVIKVISEVNKYSIIIIF